MWRMRYLFAGFMVSIWLCGFARAVFADPAWSIEGEYFEGCTCNPGCPCLFGSEPTHNKTCKISGVFHIKKGVYGQHTLDGQTVIGITDLTARPDKNWIVFYIDEKAAAVQKNALLDIFQNHVFSFAKVPHDRITVKYVPVQTESSPWHKKASAANNLILDIELLHGTGDPDKPTQIVNKNFRFGQRNLTKSWIWERLLPIDSRRATRNGITMGEADLPQPFVLAVTKASSGF